MKCGCDGPKSRQKPLKSAAVRVADDHSLPTGVSRSCATYSPRMRAVVEQRAEVHRGLQEAELPVVQRAARAEARRSTRSRGRSTDPARKRIISAPLPVGGSGPSVSRTSSLGQCQSGSRDSISGEHGRQPDPHAFERAVPPWAAGRQAGAPASRCQLDVARDSSRLSTLTTSGLPRLPPGSRSDSAPRAS